MKKVILSMLCMAFMQALIGQTTHWTPVTGIQNNMTMSAVLYINGEEQSLDSVEIGAFCGEECRAAALPYEIVGQQVYFLTIRGTSNEVITFRLYDHPSEAELDYVCDTTYTFVIDDVVGEYPEWFPIPFSNPAPTVVEQTIALAAGYNWFSTYVDISLSDLEDALVAALPDATNIKITAQDGKNRTYNGTTWRGNNFNWDVSQMYIIKCPSACELTLQGLPINPAEHPITINPGYNWIGFPLSESMTVTDAFAGFPVTNDKITNQAGSNSTYTGSSWRKAFNLVPGQGYIYKSASSETRTFVFPTSAK